MKSEGAVSELLTAAQMRAIEAAAIASGEVTGLELMERAGRGVVEAVFAEWPELAAGPFRAVVLCGPGNNGGDGFVVARLLKEWGWEVEVFLYGTPEGMPPDARVKYERWVGRGEVTAVPIGGYNSLGVAVVVDALFGIGMNRPVNPDPILDPEGRIVPDQQIGPTLTALCDSHDLGGALTFEERLKFGAPYAVAVDIPSGLSADTGNVLAPANSATCVGARAWTAAADLTVTFHRMKPGHVLGEGPRRCGKVVVKDIGL